MTLAFANQRPRPPAARTTPAWTDQRMRLTGAPTARMAMSRPGRVADMGARWPAGDCRYASRASFDVSPSTSVAGASARCGARAPRGRRQVPKQVFVRRQPIDELRVRVGLDLRGALPRAVIDQR